MRFGWLIHCMFGFLVSHRKPRCDSPAPHFFWPLSEAEAEAWALSLVVSLAANLDIRKVMLEMDSFELSFEGFCFVLWRLVQRLAFFSSKDSSSSPMTCPRKEQQNMRLVLFISNHNLEQLKHGLGRGENKNMPNRWPTNFVSSWPVWSLFDFQGYSELENWWIPLLGWERWHLS